jgi:hypothetical protein
MEKPSQTIPAGPFAAGYIFLCPPEHFKVGASSFHWPECTAYWSLDPLGIDHLSMEGATRLGFPVIRLHGFAWGYSWDATVYEGLRKFHEAKGFDPHSQDVAQHLGYPLYELTCDVDAPFADGAYVHSHIVLF